MIMVMQISWFSSLSRIIHQIVFRKTFAKIGWILMTGERSRRFWMCMQISPWLPSWICKLISTHLKLWIASADFQTQKCGSRQLISKLKQDNPSEGFQKKIHLRMYGNYRYRYTGIHTALDAMMQVMKTGAWIWSFRVVVTLSCAGRNPTK